LNLIVNDLCVFVSSFNGNVEFSGFFSVADWIIIVEFHCVEIEKLNAKSKASACLSLRGAIQFSNQRWKVILDGSP
jgi:hypothetical protein